MARNSFVLGVAAVACAVAAMPAAAQTAPAQNPPDQAGFFRPRPDHNMSLHAPDLPQPQPLGTPTDVPRVQPPAPVPAAPVQPVQVQPALPLPLERAVVQQWTQEEIERQARLDQEHARAQASQAPTPINGAFTGLTSERDR